MKHHESIYVAGHTGLVGSALVRTLKEQGYDNLILRTYEQLDLRVQQAVEDFFKKEKPKYIFLAAARVGGIDANRRYQAQFIYDNLMIQSNVIHAAYRYGVEKLLFLGSSCIYPRLAEQPIKEEYLLSGPLETTNQSYAIAKIAGIQLCKAYAQQYGCNFISCMPTNLYGPFDNFDLDYCHVIPALMAKMHQALLKNNSFVTIWGSGNALREFLYVDDLARAAIFLMHQYQSTDPINIGFGKDIRIKEVAFLIKQVVGYQGELIFDNGYPDGTPRKLLDMSKLTALGWRATTLLQDGLLQTYQWYKNHYSADMHVNYRESADP